MSSQSDSSPDSPIINLEWALIAAIDCVRHVTVLHSWANYPPEYAAAESPLPTGKRLRWEVKLLRRPLTEVEYRTRLVRQQLPQVLGRIEKSSGVHPLAYHHTAMHLAMIAIHASNEAKWGEGKEYFLYSDPDPSTGRRDFLWGSSRSLETDSQTRRRFREVLNKRLPSLNDLICEAKIISESARVLDEWVRLEQRSGSELTRSSRAFQADDPLFQPWESLVIALEVDRLGVDTAEFARRFGRDLETVERALAAGREELERIKTPVSDNPYVYRDCGAYYKVRFEDESGLIEAKLSGARYIHELLHHPNETYQAVDLRGSVNADDELSSDRRQLMQALQECNKRLQSIKGEMDKAEKNDDLAAVSRLQKEKKDIESEIRRLTGKGGRLRTPSNPREAARVAVSQSIKLVRDKCKTKYRLPRFAQHLEDKIDPSGTTYTYRPADPPPDWGF